MARNDWWPRSIGDVSSLPCRSGSDRRGLQAHQERHHGIPLGRRQRHEALSASLPFPAVPEDCHGEDPCSSVVQQHEAPVDLWDQAKPRQRRDLLYSEGFDAVGTGCEGGNMAVASAQPSSATSGLPTNVSLRGTTTTAKHGLPLF